MARQGKQTKPKAPKPNPNKGVAPPPVDIELTADEIYNLIAFGNRARMTGQEADEWVRIKGKLGAMYQLREGEMRKGNGVDLASSEAAGSA